MSSNLKPMAITHLTRVDIEQRLPLAFTASEDVLGRLNIGTPLNPDLCDYLVRIYEASPKPATEILLNPNTAKRDLDLILDKLDIKRDDLFWIHPKAGGTLRRQIVDLLHANLEGHDPLIQIVVGPRQVGKTTAVEHLIKEWQGKAHYATADAIVGDYGPWLEKQWQKALASGENTLLVLDEIQKVKNWTDIVKKLWDASKSRGIRVVLLGSTSLNHCLSRPIPESLSGRFVPIYVPHWSFAETQETFGCDLDQYTLYGGYPKAMELAHNSIAWQDYVGRAIINPIIDVDIYQLGRFKNVDNLRRAFRVFCQEFSTDINLTSLLNKIQHTGNTEIVKKYLNGFAEAFLLTQLHHIDDNGFPDPRKNPRIMANCPAVFTYGRDSMKSFSEDPIRFEQLVAGELSRIPHTSFGYWQQSDKIGMDYFIKMPDQQIFGITIERNETKRSLARSYDLFRKTFDGARIVSISPDNLPVFMQGQRAFLDMTAL